MEDRPIYSEVEMLERIKRTRFVAYFVGVLLGLIALIAIALGIYPLLNQTKISSGNFDISYIWTPDLERALVYLREVEEAIESVSRSNLRIVRQNSGDGNYGVIYDLNGDEASALKMAEEHSMILQDADMYPASVVADEGYYELYNVSYAMGTDLELQKANYKKIAQTLGVAATRDLVIEESPDGFAVVYKTLTDEQSSMDIAKEHAELLKSEGFGTTVFRESNNEIAYGESSYLNDILETEALYNVSYGLGPNLEAQKQNYAKVSEILGPEVAKELVIQKTPYGNYLLLYISRKDEQSTRSIAQQHARLLRRKRLRAAIIRESSDNTIVYGESYEANIPVVKPVETKKEPVQVAVKPEVSVETKKETVQAVTKPEVKKPEEKEKAAQVPPKESDLQIRIQDYITEVKKSKILSSSDKVACSVYDFTTGENIVAINEDLPLQAASMVKPLVALAFFHEVEQKRMIYGSRSKANMQSMIQRSANGATNWVMRQIGGPGKVQRILKDNYGDILTKIEIVEYIPQRGKTYRNKASARDYNNFLYAMWNGQLPYSRELRRLMALPNNDRVYDGANKVSRGTLVYDKTGSTSRLIGNMAILVAKGKNGKMYPYTLICIIERHKMAPNYGLWRNQAGDIIREISNKVYTEMKERYDLI